MNYGNAVWILFEDWAATSRRSRIDLLRLRDVPYERIVHSDGWQDSLVEFIRAEKKKRGIKDASATSAERRFIRGTVHLPNSLSGRGR